MKCRFPRILMKPSTSLTIGDPEGLRNQLGGSPTQAVWGRTAAVGAPQVHDVGSGEARATHSDDVQTAQLAAPPATIPYGMTSPTTTVPPPTKAWWPISTS